MIIFWKSTKGSIVTSSTSTSLADVSVTAPTATRADTPKRVPCRGRPSRRNHVLVG